MRSISFPSLIGAMGRYTHIAYCILNLAAILCNLNIILAGTHSSKYGRKPISDSVQYLPKNWPNQWNEGVIPFVFNYYTQTGIKYLQVLVRRGHRFLQSHSCLRFKEVNPSVAAKQKNYTYLFYDFSKALEDCCLTYFKFAQGRRTVLITPLCSKPLEVAHATLHGLGLLHAPDRPFSDVAAKNVLFYRECPKSKSLIEHFNKI